MDKLSKSLYLNTNFKNDGAFLKKYLAISLHRGKLFKLVTLAVSLYSFYLDLSFNKNAQIDALYRRNLFILHVLALVLSLAYIILYDRLEKSRREGLARAAKAVILSDIFFSLAIAALLSLNSQRFAGNIDAYIMVALVIAVIVPVYPKWVLGIFGAVHLSFLAGLSLFYKSAATLIRQFNATTAVLAALILFLTLYQYNIKSFLNEEMLKERKAIFLKLFESIPFPLVISSLGNGRIQYANRKAMLFYGIDLAALGRLTHHALYKNPSDLKTIEKMLEADSSIGDYVVEQVTVSGQVKNAIVNYELIEYLGEKAILSGAADITEIKRMENELKVHATTDALTGALNRRVGMELLKKKFEAANRENRGFALCFFDIDNLKAVNDRFGHLEGDALILEVCRAVREELKPGDTLFRYGGDEFMIICDAPCEDETESTCRRIGQRFEALCKNKHKPYPINASMGMFFYRPEMNLTLEQLVARVDRDMYRKKLKKE